MLGPRRTVAALAAVGLGLVLWAAWRAKRECLPIGDPRRPDVMLVSIDTLRADHVGAWGYERPTTPFLDELAATGTRFANAWAAAPWTLPSHATLLTGLLPIHHGAVEGDIALPRDCPLLAESFAAAGYATGGFVATLYVSRQFGFDRGFAHFDDFGIADEHQNLSEKPTAAAVFARALAWGRALPAGQPAFLFVHLYDAHYPYEPPAPWETRFDRAPRQGDARYRTYSWFLARPLKPAQLTHQVAQYDEAIAYVDDELRTFVEAWRADRPAILSVVADHGEEFGERGSWGHAHTLYPEALHVPWIVNGPPVAPGVVDEHVGLEDVAATLAGVAGIAFPAGDGLDRAAQLEGRRGAMGETGRFAETSRRESLVVRWHRDGLDLIEDLRAGTSALCDLAADATCRRDAAAERPLDVVRLEEELRAVPEESWRAARPGAVTTDGVIFQYREPRGAVLPVEVGDAFAVLPEDATVWWSDGAAREGPWRGAGGGAPPVGAPITFTGKTKGATRASLDEAQKEALRQLGYVE